MNRLRYCSLKMIDAKNEKYPSSCRQINYQSSLKKKKKKWKRRLSFIFLYGHFRLFGQNTETHYH